MTLAAAGVPEATSPNTAASVSSELSRRMRGQAQALFADSATRLLSRTPVPGDRCPEPKELLSEEVRRSTEPLLSTWPGHRSRGRQQLVGVLGRAVTPGL